MLLVAIALCHEVWRGPHVARASCHKMPDNMCARLHHTMCPQAAPRTTRAGAAGRARRITLDTHDLQGLLANSTAKLQQLIVSGI